MRVLTAIGCLLFAGGIIGGQTSVGPLATADALTSPRPTGSAGYSPQGSPSPRLPAILTDDVGVWKISVDIYVPFGDTVFPACAVKNFGSQTQTNVPVVCVVYDTAAGSRVYGPETVYVSSIKPGIVLTAEFPPWVPPAEEKVYLDTMTTALPGDEKPENDWKAGRLTVSDWGNGHPAYLDGTFENAISWTEPGGELTAMFSPSVSVLTIDKVVLWVASWYGDDYDAEVRVRENDGSPHGYPGTQLGAWVGKLHTDTWPFLYRNKVHFDPPAKVDSDTFFICYYQTSIFPGYPFLGIDVSAPVERGNDWIWKPATGQWRQSSRDGYSDFGVDVYYTAAQHDGSTKEITVPDVWVDSNTTFAPQVVVRNCGLQDCSNIPARFYVIRNSDLGDTLYAGTANSGPVESGQTKVVTFADATKLDPGNYTMTGITLVPLDGRPSNDTLVRPLTVGRAGVAARNAAIGRISFSIAPNPLGGFAAARYILPQAGLATLDVYDVTGRCVRSQTIPVGRVGTVALDLRKLQAGVYVVKVETDGFSKTQKLVVGN